MEDAVRIVVLLVLVGIIWGLRRMYLFPKEWAFAFSRQYADNREDVAQARRRVRELDRKGERQVSTARSELAAHRASYDKKLDALEQRIAALRNPGTGERLARLGDVTLFEHLLTVEDEAGTHTIPLAGLAVRFDPGQRNHSIYLTRANGQLIRAKYPHHPPPADEHDQRFDEDQVRDFAVDIENAVARENSFRARIPQQLAQAQKDLARARKDTTAQDEASERLSQVEARHRDDPRRKEAHAALENARERWKDLTGHLPPK
ncbi:hypothetical protein [Streptomyces sp. NPDC042319]|uniref:hypothetical protein n=1 Tax=Streptomyces sp. NPDC042319 TaxID=3154332 RepID=UPI00341081BB